MHKEDYGDQPVKWKQQNGMASFHKAYVREFADIPNVDSVWNEDV